MTLLELLPRPPGYHLDWRALGEAYAWVRAMDDCAQDPQWHAEGDVGTHTRMALEVLLTLPSWRALNEQDRQTAALAVLLHDVAKPSCTRTDDDGRITSRGHSRRGALAARRMLWEMGLELAQREQIASLVEWHQVPYFLVERDDAERLAITVSQSARGDLLALISEADARGRTCEDGRRLLDNIALFVEQMRDLDCWDRPYAFASDHARFLFFQSPGRSRHAPAFDDTRSEVTVLAGLPGAGKDHWIAEHGGDRAVVSLDAIRQETGVDPAAEQGAVVQEARERAKGYLRTGEPFVWNATNISREVRGQVVGLLAAYNARVRIVYLEVDRATLYARNRSRPHPVPEHVIDKLLGKWTLPTPVEAHEVLWLPGHGPRS